MAPYLGNTTLEVITLSKAPALLYFVVFVSPRNECCRYLLGITEKQKKSPGY